VNITGKCRKKAHRLNLGVYVSGTVLFLICQTGLKENPIFFQKMVPSMQDCDTNVWKDAICFFGLIWLLSFRWCWISFWAPAFSTVLVGQILHVSLSFGMLAGNFFVASAVGVLVVQMMKITVASRDIFTIAPLKEKYCIGGKQDVQSSDYRWVSVVVFPLVAGVGNN